MVRFATFALPTSDYLSVILLQVLITMLVFGSQGMYRPTLSPKPLQRLFSVLRDWVFSFGFLMVIGVLTKTNDNYSRWWFFLWVVLVLLGLVASRVVERRLRKKGYFRANRRVLLVGNSENLAKITALVEARSEEPYEIAGLCEDRELAEVGGAGKNLNELCDKYAANELWFLLDGTNFSYVDQLKKQIVTLDVDIRIFTGLWGAEYLDYPKTDLLGYPVINVSVNPHTGVNRLAKGLFDRVGALLLLLGLSPVVLVIGMVIKGTSPGPVFFSQKRQGINGKVFKVYKFRSMEVHREGAGQVTQATRDDPRVTRFGRFLRTYNLDELPQLFNVLKGEMSLVGPRPHALVHNEYYKELVQDYMQRHKVKPGITGWAQVNGWRGETDTLDKMKMRVDHDIFYIRNWSLPMDIKILILTLLKTFDGKTAH